MSLQESIVQHAVEIAQNSVRDGEVMPQFFLGKNEQLHVLMAPFQNEEEKDAIAMVVREMARKLDAEFVVFLSESWVVETEDADEFMANRDKYPNVSDFPKKKDIVFILLETETQTKFGQAYISADRKMGEIKWQDSDGFTGRFANFLKKKEVH